MNKEIEQNLKKKLRLVLNDLLESLDKKSKKMLTEHSKTGKFGSGNTIRRTIDFIFQENLNFYQEVITHIKTLNLQYYSSIEIDIHKLVIGFQESFKQECFERLKKSTEIARSPILFERIIPEVEESMAGDLVDFQNTLNAFLIDLKQQKSISSFEKAAWAFEVLPQRCKNKVGN